MPIMKKDFEIFRDLREEFNRMCILATSMRDSIRLCPLKTDSGKYQKNSH